MSMSTSMEGALTARDRVGVQDFVLLEDFHSENAFLENLKKRFNEKLIYVSSCYQNNGFRDLPFLILFRNVPSNGSASYDPKM